VGTILTVLYDCLYFTGTVVARVRMNKLNFHAYQFAFVAIFDQVQRNYPQFCVGKSLKCIITDWSDTQRKGLRATIGEDVTSEILKGCQVKKFVTVITIIDWQKI